VWAERVASIDELSVARRLSAEPGFAWLDSNRSESRDGRYSFLAAWPSEEIRVEFGTEAPFSALRDVGRCTGESNARGPTPSEVPAWIGYIAYDAFWSDPDRGEPRFDRKPDPIMLFRRYPALLAIDHEDGPGSWATTAARRRGLARGSAVWKNSTRRSPRSAPSKWTPRPRIARR
jgi:anthranilate/para-aminobenzoate synthase component I